MDQLTINPVSPPDQIFGDISCNSECPPPGTSLSVGCAGILFLLSESPHARLSSFEHGAPWAPYVRKCAFPLDFYTDGAETVTLAAISDSIRTSSTSFGLTGQSYSSGRVKTYIIIVITMYIYTTMKEAYTMIRNKSMNTIRWSQSMSLEIYV